MSEKKSWGATVLGWFVVQDEQASGAEAAPAEGDASADPAASAASPSTEVPPEIFQKEPPAASGGSVDFDAVFEAAGIEPDERQRVAKAQELLAGLPAETPVAVRKQIVEASLKAFGVPIDNIIETGVAEIQALEGYIRAGAARTQTLTDDTSKKIQQFEAEVQRLRVQMQQQARDQQAVAAGCNQRKLDIQKVLEFFGQEAVARVVQASPRLHDPSAQPSGAAPRV